MKYIVIIFFSISMLCPAQNNRTETIIHDEINTVLNIDGYINKKVNVPNSLLHELPIDLAHNNFFEIRIKNIKVGYYYFGKAFGKADYFDYLVIFDTNLIIEKVKVLTYREERGGEIASKRWLNQFNGKTINQSLQYQKDVVAISGATISASSLTREVNKLLQTITILKENKLLL